MKKLKNIFIVFGIVIVLFIGGILLFSHSAKPIISNYVLVNRTPLIYPDYSEIVIPPNIAPLNFKIKEKGKQYYVKIIPAYGNPIEIYSKDSKIIMPMGSWKEMLNQNRGKKFQFDVYVENLKGHWQRFKSINNWIANENIDNYLVYRLIHPGHNFWGKLGIYQRNLQNYDEEPILLNRITDNSCMNCHSFCNNDPNLMMLHIRGGKYGGTLLNRWGNIVKVNTKTKFNKAGSYPAWHPNGKLIAFSVNNLLQFFHAVGESRDVLDRTSDLIVYDIDSNSITTCDDISSPERMETFPTWSPDGKYLYFCSAPKLDTYTTIIDGKEELLYNEIRYDLMRIRYYPESKTWGKLETVLSSAGTKMSITEPRISPDGRYLLICMSDYGNFPIYRESSDIYLVDLKTNKYYKPNINSTRAETFHSWSSNSRWFVFSSKREDGFCARPYFSYIDKNGKVYKPFLLPQKDPEFYSDYLITYNVPELIKGPVTVKPQLLATIASDQNKSIQAVLAPNISHRKPLSSVGADMQYSVR